MFIRQRHVTGPNGQRYTYYSIVETTRESGKPRQKMLYNMGTHSTIEQCIAKEQELLGWLWQPPEHYVAERAHRQAKIDFLNDALSKVSRQRENRE